MEFNSLPLEVRLEIFSKLPFLEIMKIRRVCKQWNRLINCEFKFKRMQCMQITTPDRRLFEDYFYFASIKTLLKQARNDRKFRRVKYLNAKLCPHYAELENAFDFLNSFKSLKEANLTFYISNLPSNNWTESEWKKFVISLDRLEKLTFSHPHGLKASVLLNLPSLVYLAIDSLEGVKLRYPEKLRTLATYGLFRGTLNYSQFTSLTKIYNIASDVRSISASFIESLPSLRELHLQPFHIKRGQPLRESPSAIKAKPKIFYFGFEISLNQINLNGEQLPDHFAGITQTSTRFIVRNLHRSVDNNRFVIAIDYNAMASELNDTEMFGVMPLKFPKILVLLIRGNVAEPNRLLKFFGQFEISCVRLERASLPPWFFEKLAENSQLFQGLEWLEIKTEPTMSILSGDFDFIFKFKNLYRLGFGDCPIPLNFLARLLGELKSINDVTIRQPESHSIQMERLDCSSDSKCVFILNVPESGHFHCEISSEEAQDYLSTLESRMKAGGSAKELLALFHKVELEKQTHLFMMRMYVYEQRHSIFLSNDQLRLLNFSR